MNTSNLDGENNGLSPFFQMDDLGGIYPLFLGKHQKIHVFYDSQES